MVSIEFYDPSGGIEVTQPHAARLESLSGKRIGFVTNEQWQAYRMLPLDAFPQGNGLIGEPETARLVKASGVDAVIIGNAA